MQPKAGNADHCGSAASLEAAAPTLGKPRLQPKAGNADHCGSAASLEAAAPTLGIPSQRLGTRESLKAGSKLALKDSLMSIKGG